MWKLVHCKNIPCTLPEIVCGGQCYSSVTTKRIYIFFYTRSTVADHNLVQAASHTVLAYSTLSKCHIHVCLCVLELWWWGLGRGICTHIFSMPRAQNTSLKDVLVHTNNTTSFHSRNQALLHNMIYWACSENCGTGVLAKIFTARGNTASKLTYRK